MIAPGAYFPLHVLTVSVIKMVKSKEMEQIFARLKNMTANGIIHTTIKNKTCQIDYSVLIENYVLYLS